ncbi:MAG: dienelactone hydrolase family protein [Phycisphaeraceae bacterium]
MTKYVSQFVALLLATPAVFAEVQTRDVTYNDGEVVLKGHLAYDPGLIPKLGNAQGAQAPAVLIVHQWMGLTDYEKGRADQLAKLGYVVFALDIYGVENRPKDRGEAGAMAGKFKTDRALFRKRLNLGLAQLTSNINVDPNRVVAIGYCFGGTGVLELARSGADIAGVVSFHGGLDAPTPEDAKNIKAKVLICHGADDPFVPRQDIIAMKKSFDDADVDWTMIEYSGAVHSFTQPMAGDDPSKGAAYNKQADKRSWKHMRTFFNEVMGPVDETN